MLTRCTCVLDVGKCRQGGVGFTAKQTLSCVKVTQKGFSCKTMCLHGVCLSHLIFFHLYFLCVYKSVHISLCVPNSCCSQAYDSLAGIVQSAMQGATNGKHLERQVELW